MRRQECYTYQHFLDFTNEASSASMRMMLHFLLRFVIFVILGLMAYSPLPNSGSYFVVLVPKTILRSAGGGGPMDYLRHASDAFPIVTKYVREKA
jgi:hypothetical protein